MRKPVLMALSLLGLFDSIYLLWVYTSPSSPMVCVGGGCDAVRASSYAHFGGLPVPIFGVLMYAFLVLLVFIHALLPVSFARWTEYGVTLASGMGFLVSAYLTWVEAFVLHAWCIWCVTSAIAITAIFVLSLRDLSRPAAALEAAEALNVVQRNFALILIGFIVAVPSFVMLTRHGSFPVSKPPSVATMETHLVRPDTHYYGNLNAKVTVVEFGDFECSACRRAEESARKVREKFGDRIRFAFRQFPLMSIHPQSEKAAEASECAAQQGKFWQAVDKFYANQGDLSMPALSRYAAELGLDQRRFVECLQKGEMARRVIRDEEDGRALGIHETPTFFINGRRVLGVIEYNNFAEILENELKKYDEKQAQAAPSSSPPAPPQEQKSDAPQAKNKTAPPQTPSAQSSDSMPVFGTLTQNALAASQDSATACSEAEAKKKQPSMIRTQEAEKLFKGSSQALFVDVRPLKAFRSGHIPGAMNIPIDYFEREWSRLPKGKTIVLYESGRSGKDICAASRAAGRILLAQGFGHDDVKVYQDGFASWKSSGLPVKR
jgi:protein-disulfide isomerase/rhodanese-related sulfurtransferase